MKKIPLVISDNYVTVAGQTAPGKGSLTGRPGLPDHEKDAGGWEAYPGYERSADWDTDLDGLPNWWEKTFGLNTNSAAGDFTESNADADSNGYTNLEEYLHWMDRPHYFMDDEDSIIIDLSIFTKGFTNAPVYEVIKVENGVARLQTDTSIVSFEPSAEGLAELEFKVSDTNGTYMIQKIGIFKGQITSDSTFTYTYKLGRLGGITVTVDSVNTINQVSAIYSEKHMSDVFNIALFPNPVIDRLSVMIETDINCSSDLYITDIVGRMVLHKIRYTKKGTNMINIDISTFNRGLYLIKIGNSVYRKTIFPGTHERSNY